jgi:hypothetical protein
MMIHEKTFSKKSRDTVPLKNIARGSTMSPVPRRPIISDHPELVPRTRGQTLGDARAIQRFLEQNRTHRPGSADSRITAVGIGEGGTADKRLTEAGALDSGSAYKRNVCGSGSAGSRTTGVRIGEERSADKRLTGSDGVRGSSGSAHKKRTETHGPESADKRSVGLEKIRGSESADLRTFGGASSETCPVVLNVESDEDQSDIIIVESSGPANDVICLKPASADGSKRRSTNKFEENNSKKTKT